VKTIDAGTVIVGSGIAGVLVAREIASSSHPVAIVERGAPMSWDDQMRAYESEGRLTFERGGAGSVHNDENAEGTDWEWGYLYALGGTCNHWAGSSPRLLPEDFEMRSRYGVMTDWPISYDDLSPYYEAAEDALAVAGAPSGVTPGARYPLPPHPFSRQDRAVAPHLRPFIPLPQARPTRPVGARPACCGSARCELCPVDARFSVLNGLGGVLDAPGVRLVTQTTGARLVPSPSGGRIEALDCMADDGTPVRLRARRFVVAANAIESAGLLLRSQIEEPDTGRYFAAREAITLLASTEVPVDPGHGSSIETGASYAYYSGSFRARHAAAMLIPQNLGSASPLVESVVEGVLDGHPGSDVREEAVRRWERTLALTVMLDYEPSAQNAVTLSPTRGEFDLPLNRITYDPGDYSRRGLEHLAGDLPRRLRALGVSDVRIARKPEGTHLFGTLRMGAGSEGVVDPQLRHRRLDNLFVCGGAVFPTYGATHPTLTIAALAIRLGRMLAASSE
jgi:choline dehydrogenase-like flavoprotein